MPDVPTRDEVATEAKLLVSEAAHTPMDQVLADYIKYLTDHPDVYKIPELSQTMTSNLRSILPDLIVEDIRESGANGIGKLKPTETLAALERMVEGTNGQPTPHSELAKVIIQETEFLQEVGVASADGQTFNLDELKVETRDGHRILTTLNREMSAQFLEDGTVLWRNSDNNLVAAEYQNGMIVQLSGNDARPIQSQADLAASSFVPTQITYPNGSMISLDPDRGWFFLNADTGLTSKTTELTWGSAYFQALNDTYVIPMAAEENVSRQATFSSDGKFLIYAKTVFNADMSVDRTQSETIDSVNGVLKLANEPTYRYNVDHWEVQGQDNTWKTANAAPQITTNGGFLEVRLPPDPGSVERGKADEYPGGRHLGYYPNGVTFDADYYRRFSGNVQIFDLRAGVSNLNIPGKIHLPERSVVLLPDNSTIQQDEHGQWTHYAYANDPLNPRSKGSPPHVLGAVTQPIIDSGNDNPQIYFQSDDVDSQDSLVPFKWDENNRTYTIQVNGSLETFNYGGELKSITRRDGSTIEFSSTAPVQPTRISLQAVRHTDADVNVGDVTYDAASQKWFRTETRNGQTVHTEVQVSGLSGDFAVITITNPDGSQDIFRGGGLEPLHIDAIVQATPTPAGQVNSEIQLFGQNRIVTDGSAPTSITLDESDISSLGITPLISTTGAAVTISIPADKVAAWKAPGNEQKDMSFPFVANNVTYTIVVSRDLETITVTSPTGESEVFSARNVQYNPNG